SMFGSGAGPLNGAGYGGSIESKSPPIARWETRDPYARDCTPASARRPTREPYARDWTPDRLRSYDMVLLTDDSEVSGQIHKERDAQAILSPLLDDQWRPLLIDR